MSLLQWLFTYRVSGLPFAIFCCCPIRTIIIHYRIINHTYLLILYTSFLFQVFVFMSYFNTLSQTMSSMFVRGISEIAELFVAIRRLQDFMMNEEFRSVKSQNNNDGKMFAHKDVISIRDITVKWKPDSPDVALSQMNLSVSSGDLIGIIGPVGSGKSSLLQTLLGIKKIVKFSLNLEKF